MALQHTWLFYDNDKDKVLCNSCTKLINQGIPIPISSRQVDSCKCFVENGFSSWKKALQTFQRHEQSNLHRASFIAVRNKETNVSVQKKMTTGSKAQMMKNRIALHKIFTSLQYLGFQGLTVRGKSDNDSTLIALLQERKNGIPELTAWLNGDKKYKLLSQDILNEILQGLSVKNEKLDIYFIIIIL